MRINETSILDVFCPLTKIHLGWRRFPFHDGLLRGSKWIWTFGSAKNREMEKFRAECLVEFG
jgi:hypothetical protein